MGLLVVFCKSIDTNLFICEMLEKTFCKIKGSLKHKTELCKFVGGGGGGNVSVLRFQISVLSVSDCWSVTFYFHMTCCAVMPKISGGKYCIRVRLFLKGICVLKILHSDIEKTIASEVPCNIEVFISKALSLHCVTERLFYCL